MTRKLVEMHFFEAELNGILHYMQLATVVSCLNASRKNSDFLFTIGPHASLGHVFIARARQQERGGGWGGQKCNKTDQLSGMAGVCDVGGRRIESRQATFFWLFV